MSADHDVAESFRYDLVLALREGAALPEYIATPIAEKVVASLCHRLGGLYIPRREMREDRDRAVLKTFNGRNHAEVMQEFRISRATLYRILRQA